MPRIYSFDIFDTVFVRRVALATDVFRIIGQKLAPRRLDVSCLGSFVEDFVSARVHAERLANNAAGMREDCTLQAIWHELHQLMPAFVDPADFVLELECDEELLVVNPSIAARIQSYRERGHRVIFISDIYYPHDAVLRWLMQAGLCDAGQDVYVSSEVGLVKHTGNLFKHVLKCEAIRPQDLHHIGDNVTSDCTRPKKLGIQVEHYKETRLNLIEQIVQETSRPSLLGSQLAAAMRIARLQEGACRTGDEVSAFLGPLAVLVALWSAGLAEEHGANRIYFVARDGYVPWRAATELGKLLPGVDVRYIRLSRSSLIAALPQLGEFGAFWIKQSWVDLPAHEVVDQLGYAWSDVAEVMASRSPAILPNETLPDDSAIAALVEAIDTAVLPADRQAVVEARRKQVAEYLKQEGLFDGTPFIVFDVGWFLNLQAVFKTILDAHGANGFVGGAYFGLSLGRVSEAMAGPATAMFHQRPYCLDLPDNVNFVFDRRILVEHLMGLAPHGTATGYAASCDGNIYATEGPITSHRQEVVGTLSNNIAKFASIANDVIGVQDIENERVVRLADVLLRHFVQHADNYELSALSQLYVEEDGKRNQVRTIPEPWRLNTALAQVIPHRVRERFGINHGPTLWPEMALKRAGPLALSIIGARGFVRKFVRRASRGMR